MHTTRVANNGPTQTDNIFSELRLSTWIVTVPLIAGGLVTVVSSSLRAAPTQVEEYLFALACYLAAGIIELLWHLRPSLARWTAMLFAVVLVPVGAAMWPVPGLLVLIPMPIIPAMAMLGVRGGVAATVLETGVITLLTTSATPLYEFTTLSISVLSLWCLLGILIAAHQPVIRMEEWSRMYIDRAQKLLDQARDRNAELDQVLKDLVHVNRQLDLANERLAVARSVAEEAQKSKADFVGKVSHEFRTPLNMIIGLTDFLLKQVGNGKAELRNDMLKDIQIIHRNSEHLSTMINDVLDLSQVEAGQLTLRRRWVDLTEEIAEAINVVHPLLEKKGLDVALPLPDDLPQVYCDPVRIRQVLLNLVSNAARHSVAGQIRIGAEVAAGYVTVSVTDSGPGIAQADLLQIFEPFFRREDSEGQGSGLGLTISKQLIEQHNGKIWAESELGRGSTFFFKLPVMPFTVPTAGAKGWISEEWIWKERTQRAELPRSAATWRMIICDEGGRIYPLISKLTGDDVELIETQNLAQTVAQLKDIPAHVVILNEEDPAALWQRLSEAKALIPDTPLVGCSIPAITGHEETPDIVDYLIKPVTRADLRDAIDTLSPPVRKILVVDDDQDVRELFARMLLDLDAALEVTTVADGDAALAWMREGQCDLVLLDIIMPNRDGWSVLQEKQTIAQMRDVPVFIMSAQDPEGQATKSVVVAATDRDGLSGEAIVQTAFQLGARLRRQSATLGPESPEIVDS